MKKKILIGLAAVFLVFLLYYIILPPINIHSQAFWIFLLFLFAFLSAVTVLPKKYRFVSHGNQIRVEKVPTEEKAKGKVFLILFGVTAIVFIIGLLASAPVFNAKRYRDLIHVEKRIYQNDIKEVSFDQIPILDRDSANLLAERKMGTLVDMVSQFEVGDKSYQINYREKPYRVIPLKYANWIKWLTNSGKGIPAYLRINMTNQVVENVALPQGMKFSIYEHFGRYLYRHLRFHYPTYMFANANFEIDDEGTPYWICPVKKFTIGLFGGQKIGRVILVNALTGELKNYKIEDVPTWVDRVYSSSLLLGYYDYYGSFVHGFFNSIFGQKNVTKTTEGYNYIALEDDVWVYTGVTSVTGDKSNLGFVLMNQRTSECRYYEVAGATETSAMNSAEGQVQHLHYKATFPILLNIANQPTYFLSLKDNAGLVKKYAMVDIERYNLVGIGDTLEETEKNYLTLLSENGVKGVEGKKAGTHEEGIINHLQYVVIDGNTHLYLTLENNPKIYDIPVKAKPEAILLKKGDKVRLNYLSKEAQPLEILDFEVLSRAEQ